MKRALFLLWVWAAATLPAMASGLIIIHDEGFWRHYPPPFVPVPPPYPIPRPPPYVPPPSPVWAPLEVTFNQVNVQIKDQIAVTKVEQEFYNPNPRQLEGTFLFPVPKGAHLDKFTMEIGGKQVEAELLAADKARGIYEDIVRRLKDPALLEYSGRDLFKVRIFPIEANSRKRITLAYSQVLKSDNGLVSYMFPLNTEKYSAKPLKTLGLKVTVETRRPLKTIYSPSHKVEVKRDGPHKATIGYEAGDVRPDTDFQLFFTQEDAELGVSVMNFKAAGDDGYFMLLASPGADVKNNKIVPKDVAFVLDTSGSMAGAKLEQAKKALLFCVENLNDNDRFEILRFSTEVEPLFDQMTEAARENRARAEKFIRDLKPTGGTAIDDALRKALALRPEKGDRPYVIIFLTDGRPTIGNVDENQIVDGVIKANKGNVRVFCFGIGHDVNARLLDRITEETKAFSQYVLPEEDIEVKVSGFFAKIKEPVLASPQITFPDGVRVTKLYPAPLPDLFKGEQLVLVGRYDTKLRPLSKIGKAGERRLTIEGTVNGEKKTFTYEADFPEEAADHEFIPRLWATRRVGYLLDEIRLRGESQELKDEVTELARKYSIVTPYTAYLIVEDEKQRGVTQNLQSLPRLQQDGLARREADRYYRDFKQKNEGEQAVAGARSSSAFKRADVASEAIPLGYADAVRPQASPMPAGEARGFGAGINLQRQLGGAALAKDSPAYNLSVSGPTARLVEYTQQTRFVNGRSFYQNGEQWVDSEVQKAPQARRVRVQFDSPEYFDLLKQNPKALAWLSLGRNVQLLLNDTVYEVHE